MEQYLNLLDQVLSKGRIKQSRNGRVKGITGATFTHDMDDGFPLLTTKKVNLNKVLSELLWFISGSDNELDLRGIENHQIRPDELYELIKAARREIGIRLSDHRISPTIHNNDRNQKILADKRREFAKLPASIWFPWTNQKAGDGFLGSIYGTNWRNFRSLHEYNNNTPGVDQIERLENLLATENFHSRRLLVNAWNPTTLPNDIYDTGLNLTLNYVSLPACHFAFQLIIETHENDSETTLPCCSLVWFQRSVDVCVGLPFNIASYAMLLRMICHIYQLVPYQIVGMLSDVHVYEEHIPTAMKQLERNPLELPTLLVTDTDSKTRLVDFNMDSFALHQYDYHPFLNYQIKP